MINHWDKILETTIESETDIQELVKLLNEELGTDHVRTVVRVWRGTE